MAKRIYPVMFAGSDLMITDKTMLSPPGCTIFKNAIGGKMSEYGPMTDGTQARGVKIVLTATESALGEAWRDFFGDFSCVTVHQGSIFEVSCDAVVSPSNSYGFMDGGIDSLYIQQFGPAMQDRLQRAIVDRHHGELLVGAAEIIATDNARVPYLIAAPTMRVPMVLGPETVNPYLAARAVFLLIRHGVLTCGEHVGEKISAHVRTVAFPGMGTGVGRVPFAVCAWQMGAAIEEFLLDGKPFPRPWAEASERHQLLYTDRLKRLQHQ